MDEPKGGDSPPIKNDTFVYPDDPYGGYDPANAEPVEAPKPAVEAPKSVESAVVPAAAGGARKPPPPPPPPVDDPDDEGMVRMSFLGHLEELRSRIIRALMGFGVAFILCIGFAYPIWDVVSAPARAALQQLGIKDGHLVITEPMEGFSVIWVKVPFVVSLFVASPWVLYQIWAFIAPGLYKRERRWAVPFVLTTAGLFILGGSFAYFVAFRYGLAFLLGLGLPGGVVPFVTITSYFDLFTNVTLGVALVFELPLVIFFLTLLRMASPRWLLKHSRYAILVIVIIAAVVTPTPDVFNLMLFAVPMVALYFVGILASFVLVYRREGKQFPWMKILLVILLILLLAAGGIFLAIYQFHYHPVRHWPFLIR
jgi:sec-independent protein translocase protein TatC